MRIALMAALVLAPPFLRAGAPPAPAGPAIPAAAAAPAPPQQPPADPFAPALQAMRDHLRAQVSFLMVEGRLRVATETGSIRMLEGQAPGVVDPDLEAAWTQTRREFDASYEVANPLCKAAREADNARFRATCEQDPACQALWGHDATYRRAEDALDRFHQTTPRATGARVCHLLEHREQWRGHVAALAAAIAEMERDFPRP